MKPSGKYSNSFQINMHFEKFGSMKIKKFCNKLQFDKSESDAKLGNLCVKPRAKFLINGGCDVLDPGQDNGFKNSLRALCLRWH